MSKFFNSGVLTKGLAKARDKFSSFTGKANEEEDEHGGDATTGVDDDTDSVQNIFASESEEMDESFASTSGDFGVQPHSLDENGEEVRGGLEQAGRRKLSKIVSKVKQQITTLPGGGVGERLDEALLSLYGDVNELEMRCKADIGRSKKSVKQSQHTYDNDQIASQQNAFVESLKVAKKSPEEVIESFDKRFFEADFDPVPLVIEEVSAWPVDEGESNDIFMKRIEVLDTDKDLLESKLGDLIDSHHSDIMQCMRSVETINTDLHDATRQIDNSRGLVLRGAGTLSDGPLKVTDLMRQMKRLEDVFSVVNSLNHIRSIFDAMETCIVTGNLGSAAECAYNMLYSYRHDDYNRFSSLARLPSKIQKSVLTIRRKADLALMRLSGRKFASKEYESIVRCYLALDWIEETQSVRLVDTGNETTTSDSFLDKFPCIDGLADRVQSFQHDDVGKCLRTGVLEFIYASRQHKNSLTSAMGASGASVGLLYASEGASMDDSAELEDLPLEDLYPKVLPELMIPCIVRSCELLVDVVHTHYLITQWHLTPFDPRNEDTMWLHRKPIDPQDVLHETPWGYAQENEGVNEDEKTGDGLIKIDIEESESASSIASGITETRTGAEDFSDSTEAGQKEEQSSVSPRGRRANGPSSLPLRSNTRLRAEVRAEITGSFCQHYDSSILRKNSEKTTAERQIGLQSMQLSSCYQALCGNRAALWDSLMEGLEGALDLVSLTSAVSQSDFLHMSWAINAMVRLGKQFCGNDSTGLQSCLELKSREYYSQVHGESFYILKQMIDNDSWNNIPVSVQELGGIMQVIATSTPALATTGQGGSNKRTLNMGLGGMTGLAFEAQLGIFDSSRKDIYPSSSQRSKDDAPAAENTNDNSILVFFGYHGNPLHFMTDIGADIDSEGDSEEDSEEESDEQLGGNRTNPNEGKEKADHKTGTIAESEEDIFRRLLISPEHSELSSQKQKRKAQTGDLIVTQAAFGGLTRCAGRYMQMMFLMPSTAPIVFQGLRQLFDLYVCSVFSGFVPSAERAAFLSPPSRMASSSPDTRQEFDALRNYLGRALSEVVHCTRPSDEAQEGSGEPASTKERSFTAGNVPLSSMLVELESLEYGSAEGSDADLAGVSAKVVAAESLSFASSVLSEIRPKLLRLLPKSYAGTCDDFFLNFQTSTTQLRALVYRSMCPELLRAQEVIQDIIESSGWDSKLPAMSALLPGKNSSSSPDPTAAGVWVQRLVTTCARVWAHMESLGDKSWGSAAPLVREQVWLELCQAAFDTSMEGFWRVRRVSSEGRRSMIRDVRALHAGLDQVHPCRCPHGLEQIEAILQAALLDSEEMMIWVQDNHTQYTYRNLLGLITQTFSSVMGMNQSRLKDAVGFLDELFDEIEGVGQNQGSKEFAHLFRKRRGPDSDRSSIRESVKSAFKGVGMK